MRGKHGKEMLVLPKAVSIGVELDVRSDKRGMNFRWPLHFRS